jgi:hypothetical protein
MARAGTHLIQCADQLGCGEPTTITFAHPAGRPHDRSWPHAPEPGARSADIAAPLHRDDATVHRGIPSARMTTISADPPRILPEPALPPSHGDPGSGTGGQKRRSTAHISGKRCNYPGFRFQQLPRAAVRWRARIGPARCCRGPTSRRNPGNDAIDPRRGAQRRIRDGNCVRCIDQVGNRWIGHGSARISWGR